MNHVIGNVLISVAMNHVLRFSSGGRFLSNRLGDVLPLRL